MSNENVSPGAKGAAPGAEAGGQRRVRMQVEERNLSPIYANAFRTNSTTEEMVLDFGVNLPNPAAAESSQPDVLFVIHSRVVLNYYSAKRLALTLGQHIRRHEEQFGELEIDAEKRRRPQR